MKRLLKKKAWGTVDLYHVTNSQIFMMIYENGQIAPSAYTDRTSYGTGDAQPHRDVYNPAIHSPDQMKTKTLDDLLYDMQNAFTGVTYTDQLRKKIEERVNQIKTEHPDDYEQFLENERMEILETITPSGDSNGVYLSGRAGKGLYRSSEWKNRPWQQLPAWNVELQIKCEEDALGPDLDDSFVDKNSDVPPWKQTLQKDDQCIHYGPILNDSITGVWFDEIKLYNMGNYYATNLIYSMDDIFKNNITTRQWLSLNDAYQQCFNFYKEVNDMINEAEQATAKIKSTRLKKRAD